VRHGEFSGDPETVWLTEEGTDDRKMSVLRDFSFKDPAAKVWRAPAGSVIDGASIPRALWTIVGSPYTGDYRRASIVHDVACDQAGSDEKKRRAADRMFFHACRAGGCSIWQSIVLYLGVRIGAAAPKVPAWHAAVAMETSGPRIRRTADELRLERDFHAEPAKHAEQIISLCGLCDLCVETACTTAISPIFSTTAFPTSSD
jgi:Protein of unknown function (DUF1353)